MLKSLEIAKSNSCLNKADADEPLFVLRANDPIAPMVVRIWASLSSQMGAHDRDKTCNAFHAAQDMEAWYRRMYGDPTHDWKK